MRQNTGLEGYYSIKNNKKMRFGYTTGSCAAGAAKAAAVMLLLQEHVAQVELMTPKGILLNLEILHVTKGKDWVSCAVRKDAGDDPDMTNGLEIFARVEKKMGQEFVLTEERVSGELQKKVWSSPQAVRLSIRFPVP